MNIKRKSQIARYLQKRFEETRGLSISLLNLEHLIRLLSEHIVDTVSQGYGYTIDGVGRIKRSKFKATNRVNPQTKEPLRIPAHYRPGFEPADDFIKAVRSVVPDPEPTETTQPDV